MSIAGSSAGAGERRPRHFPAIGVGLIVLGISIAAVSLPVSQASHSIRDEINRRKVGEAGVRAAAKGLVNAMLVPMRLAEAANRPNDPNGPVFLWIIALPCCCCAWITGWFAEWLVVPLGETLGNALGVASQFSVYTFAALFVVLGLVHSLTGVGLLRGRAWSRVVAIPLLGFNGYLGMFYLVASFPLGHALGVGSVLGPFVLGLVLTSFCFASWWQLRRSLTSPPLSEGGPAS